MNKQGSIANTYNAQEPKWSVFIEKYFNSWPEWKKKSGFCYHTSMFDRTPPIAQLSMGDTDIPKR